MAGRPAVEVVGLSRLARTMKRAGVEITELKELNRAAADAVAPVARSTAPVLSGRLAADVRTAGTQRAGIIRVGRASLPYAGPIHWGWPARRISPQPFAADAAAATEPAWTQIYLAGIEKIIGKIEGK